MSVHRSRTAHGPSRLGPTRTDRPLLVRLAVATATVAIALSTVGPLEARPAGAQGSAVARWVDVEGTCSDESLVLDGSLQIDVLAGDVVSHTYTLTTDGDVITVGDDRVPSTASVDATVDYDDTVWFSPTWAVRYPYTYVQTSTVTRAGTTAFRQELTATCQADGGAGITTEEGDEPRRPRPVDPAQVVPRFAG